jgi:cholestenol Delta-isomerase
MVYPLWVSPCRIRRQVSFTKKTILLTKPGYLVWNAGTLASDQSIIGQLWKEYALSDSRYLTGDTQILVLETLAACVLGPLCFLAAKDTVEGIPRSAITQTIVAVMHLYGVSIYYATSLVELSQGVSYSRPEPLYFWGYFVAFNAPWIIVPSGKLAGIMLQKADFSSFDF